MSRPLVSYVIVLMLCLQGVAWSHADVPHETSQQHCEMHSSVADDCECCPPGVPMPDDCAALCALSAAMPVTVMNFAATPGEQPQALLARGRLGPDHLPLNPPPIS